MSTSNNKSHGKRIFNTPSTEKLPQHRQLTRIATSFLKVDEIRSSPLLRPDIFLQPATRYNISKCLPLSWHLPTPPSSSPMRVLRSPYEQTRACDGRKPPRQDDPADIGSFFYRPTSSRPLSRLVVSTSSPSGPLCSPRYDPSHTDDARTSPKRLRSLEVECSL